MTSASVGFSRRVGIKNCDQRILYWSICNLNTGLKNIEHSRLAVLPTQTQTLDPFFSIDPFAGKIALMYHAASS